MSGTSIDAPDFPRCGAQRKHGRGPCRNYAGKGTDHVGRGRCKYHGGATPIKHGRYSTVSDQRLSELMDELEDDPVPLDVSRELILARALIHDWLERYTKLREQLEAWNESRRDEDRPARIPDVQEVGPLLERVSRMVYRVERAQSDQYIPRGKLLRLMQAMGRAVDARVPEELAKAIHEDWMRIELP